MDELLIELGANLDPDVFAGSTGLEWEAARERLAQAIRLTLEKANRPAAQLALVITDDEEVRALNLAYREIDAPTDVLSFAIHEQEDPGAQAGAIPAFVVASEAQAALENELGDILIALPYSLRQAERYENSALGELSLLAVHGTLHLLGYDHDTPENEAHMWALQDAVLAALGEKALSRRDFDDT